MREGDPKKVRHRSRGGSESGRPGWREGSLRSLYDFFSREVWLPDLHAVSRLRAAGLGILRLLYLTSRGFSRDACTFRAAALTYITVLSLVPFLAVSVSVAKGFGGYQELRDQIIMPNLDRILPPAEEGEGGDPQAPPDAPGGGEEEAPAPGEPPAEVDGGEAAPPGEEEQKASGQELREMVLFLLDRVERTDFKKLGAFGLIILVWTVLKLLGSVERSFNEIWGVRRARRLYRKLSDYLTLVVITPIFLVTALGLFTLTQFQTFVDWLRDTLRLAPVIELFLSAAPLITLWAGLGLVYLTLPNTRVRLSSAVLGGALAAVVSVAALVAHTHLQVGVANLSAIYASFAAFPIFMFFVFLLWTGILLGAELAAAHQSAGAFREIILSRPADRVHREEIALRALARVGMAFLKGDRPPTTVELADAISVPARSVREVFDVLADRGVLSRHEGGERDGWLPAIDPSRLRVKTVLDRLGSAADRAGIGGAEEPGIDRRIDRALQGLAQAAETSSHNLSLRELVLAELEAEAAEGTVGDSE